MCSAVRRLQISESEAWDDLAGYGAPSECGALVADSIERDYIETLSEFGFSPRSFIDELRERTTDKVVYFEFGQVLSLCGWGDEESE